LIYKISPIWRPVRIILVYIKQAWSILGAGPARVINIPVIAGAMNKSDAVAIRRYVRPVITAIDVC